MIDRKQTLVGGVAAVLMLSSGLVQAALSPAVDGMVYDDELDLCWLQDANASGQQLNWSGAVAWAEALDFGGHTDWRLAQISNTSPTDTPFDCSVGTEQDCIDSGNELGYMFYYNLPDPFPKTGNQGPFLNIQDGYWSGTEFASRPGFAWGFGPAMASRSPAVRTSRSTVGQFAPDNVEPRLAKRSRSPRWVHGAWARSVCC